MVLHSFKEVVQDYIARYRDRANNELASFQMLNSLDEAVERAARAEVDGGRKHDHQWRIPEAVLARAGKELLAKRAQIRKCTGFDSLIELVETTAGSIRGFGELAIYDTAVRIGARLGMEPEFVYLHRGTRKGAKALGLASGGKYLKVGELPAEFTKLRPHEIEDCLCIYAKELARLKRASVNVRAN
ncbi:Exodeoxyribonuclease V beta chain [Nitrospira tepida]|nr:Exodeoxyribonuclease V beta chain [Nitrospira tepida]